MSELTTTLKRPMDKASLGNDSLALNNLCGFLNNPAVTGAEAPPKGAEPSASLVDKTGATIAKDPLAMITETLPSSAAKALEDLAAPPAAESYDRLFFTGRLCVGKDYIAKLCGAQIFGFADPLYAVAKYFFGIEVTSEKNKDVPGMRAFLQAVGQWGRGTVSEKYPYTPARAMFIQAIRGLGLGCEIDPNHDLKVNWSNYGLSENIWLDAALDRIYKAQASRVALTNVRFSNEFKRLNNEPGWTHFHVMTSAKEWADRLAKRGLKTDAPVLKDISEIMAHQLDQNVIKQISGQKTGPKIHCIWNSTTPPPSPRLWTVAEFLAACAVTPATTSDFNDLIMTE